jgi:type IV pilus assembly protein PilQ
MVMERMKLSKAVGVFLVALMSVLASGVCIGAIPEQEPISMDFQSADINTVLRSFSVYTDKNIIAGPEVEGPVTVHLEEVPWRDALDIVLRANGYAAQEEEGIIRVGLWDQFLNEEITLNEAARKREDLIPLTTRVVAVSFAQAHEMISPLQGILSRRGVLEVDDRTNAVIINDIPEKVEEISKLILELDEETQQVEISAKLVDVDFRATRELGIDWSAQNVTIPGIDGVYAATVDATGQLEGGTGVTDATVSEPKAELNIGQISGPNGMFEATIHALERENKATIISNPTITTLNNREALIIVGKKIPLIVSDEAGNPITQLTTVGIQMRVVPHVNSETGEITMDLHPEVSDLSSQATVQGGIIIVTSEADTRVMVRDGETAVIGGLIRDNEGYYDTGVPILRDIPLFGRLFGSKTNVGEKRELLIFVTPKLVD